MVKDVVSFILLFMILMEKCGFSSSPSGCAQQNCIILCPRLGTQCLVEDKYPWEGIRLGGSTTDGFLIVTKLHRSSPFQCLPNKLSFIKITPFSRNQMKTLILRGIFNFHIDLFRGMASWFTKMLIHWLYGERS